MVPFSEKRASPKPPRGEKLIARRVTRKRVESARASNKVQAKRRDGYQCRYPRCSCRLLKLPLESAHLIPLSLGGTDDLSNLLTLCVSRHRGASSLHSGDIKAVPTATHGANGPVDFIVDGCYVGTTEPGARK